MKTLPLTTQFILLVLLSACTGLPSQFKQSAPRIFVLEAPAPSLTYIRKQGPKIMVALPHAWPGLGSVNIAYVKRAHEINYYAHSEWADTPTRMLEPLFIHALEASGDFGAVVGSGSTVLTELRLDSDFVTLEQDFTHTPSQGVVVLRVQLVDLQHDKVLGSRTFKAEIPAGSEDATGGVAAMNKALQQVLGEVVGFIQQTI